MADEEKAPLLVNEEPDPVDYRGPRQKIRSLYQSERVSGGFASGDEGRINISASNSISNLAEIDQIVSIFVVAFDTRSGIFSLIHVKIYDPIQDLI